VLALERGRERREERNALVRAGETLAAGALAPTWGTELAQAWREARTVLDWRQGLEDRLAASLAEDRCDYQAAPTALSRLLTVARGLFERLRLREQARGLRPRARQRLECLGRLALEDPLVAPTISQEARAEIERAQGALRRVDEQHQRLVAPYGGRAVPAWIGSAADELCLLLRSLRDELRRKLLLRAPALAAMAAAWWLAHTYTDSVLEAAWHGLTGEGRAGLSRAALERLSFWVPLGAAVLTAYLTATVARRVERRYAVDESS
jgi:hypothetical protein